jgi:hypothetical protein
MLVSFCSLTEVSYLNSRLSKKKRKKKKKKKKEKKTTGKIVTDVQFRVFGKSQNLLNGFVQQFGRSVGKIAFFLNKK